MRLEPAQGLGSCSTRTCTSASRSGDRQGRCRQGRAATRTTGWKPTTADSRPGCGRCVGCAERDRSPAHRRRRARLSPERAARPLRTRGRRTGAGPRGHGVGRTRRHHLINVQPRRRPPALVTDNATVPAALDEVRRRVQQDTTGHRGRRGDPLYRIRRALRRTGRRVVLPGPRGSSAWPHAAVLAPEWRAYFSTDAVNNCPVEATNLRIETSRRIAYGFRNCSMRHCRSERLSSNPATVILAGLAPSAKPSPCRATWLPPPPRPQGLVGLVFGGKYIE